MRIVCLALIVVVAACKEKQEAKPTPPAPAPAVEQQPAPTPPAEPPAPTAEPARVVKPAGGINTPAEYEAKAFDLTDKLTSAFAAAGTNCDKLADNLEIFIDANKAALASTDAFEAANPFAEDDLEPKLQARAKRLIQKMSVSMQACQKHQGVQTALAKLPD
jgi:hypothetical protein